MASLSRRSFLGSLVVALASPHESWSRFKAPSPSGPTTAVVATRFCIRAVGYTCPPHVRKQDLEKLGLQMVFSLPGAALEEYPLPLTLLGSAPFPLWPQLVVEPGDVLGVEIRGPDAVDSPYRYDLGIGAYFSGANEVVARDGTVWDEPWVVVTGEEE